MASSPKGNRASTRISYAPTCGVCIWTWSAEPERVLLLTVFVSRWVALIKYSTGGNEGGFQVTLTLSTSFCSACKLVTGSAINNRRNTIMMSISYYYDLSCSLCDDCRNTITMSISYYDLSCSLCDDCHGTGSYRGYTVNLYGTSGIQN